MSLIISKTYADATIFTEADLDNIYTSLLTLVSSTLLDETFLNLDQILNSLTSLQANAFIEIVQPTQANAFIDLATSSAPPILQSNRRQFYELRNSIPYSGSAPYNNILIFTPPDPVGIYLYSFFFQGRWKWATQRTTGIPTGGTEVFSTLRVSFGADTNVDNTPSTAYFRAATGAGLYNRLTPGLATTPSSGPTTRVATGREAYSSHTFISTPDYTNPISRSIYFNVQTGEVSSATGTVLGGEFSWDGVLSTTILRIA